MVELEADRKLQGFNFVDLCAVSWALERYGIYAVGADGDLYEKYWVPEKDWRGWNPLGHPEVKLAGSIAATKYVEGAYAVYALGSNTNVYERVNKFAEWKDWTNLGRPHQSSLNSLCAVSSAATHTTIAGVTTDGRLATREYSWPSWGDWQVVTPIPGVTLAGPIAATIDGSTEIFFVQASDGRYFISRGGQWEQLSDA